jgi:chorismate mutase
MTRELATEEAAPPSESLGAIRREIDRVDRALVALLGDRVQLARRARAIKARLGRGVVDVARERAVFEERRRWAAEHGLDGGAVVEVFEAIVRLARRAQGWTG